MIRKFILLLVVFSMSVIGFSGFRIFQMMFLPTSQMDQKMVFTIMPGTPFYRVGLELEKAKAIKSAQVLRIFGSLLGFDKKIRVGEYEISPKMSAFEILKKLSSGQSIEYSLTLQEGINMYEVAQLIEKKKLGRSSVFLKLCKNKKLIQELLGQDLPSLEGYLFPETYFLTKFTGEEKLIRKMVNRFKSVYSEFSQEEKPLIKSRHEAVILGSVIEKETGAGFERPLISSVFHNRLKKKMRLQSDPTILYGILEQTGIMKKNITKRDILAPTKYNTYTVKGLPSGPISNPGRESLKAALYPKASEYLFFVSRNDGTHVFTTSYKDHLAAVRKFQLDSKARQGKSWRDLKQ